jgi:hypothetical protein
MPDPIVLPSSVDEPTRPFDLTIIAVLGDGRHLSYSNIVREADDPERMVLAHCAVRRFYHPDVSRFVVLMGASAERFVSPQGAR